MKSKIVLLLALSFGATIACAAESAGAPAQVGRFIPTLVKYDDGRVLMFMTDTTTGITKAIFGVKPFAGGRSAQMAFDYMNTPFPEVKENETQRMVAEILNPALYAK